MDGEKNLKQYAWTPSFRCIYRHVFFYFVNVYRKIVVILSQFRYTF